MVVKTFQVIRSLGFLLVTADTPIPMDEREEEALNPSLDLLGFMPEYDERVMVTKGRLMSLCSFVGVHGHCSRERPEA